MSWTYTPVVGYDNLLEFQQEKLGGQQYKKAMVHEQQTWIPAAKSRKAFHITAHRSWRPKICRFFDPIGTTAGNNFLTKWMHVSLDLFTMKWFHSIRLTAAMWWERLSFITYLFFLPTRNSFALLPVFMQPCHLYLPYTFPNIHEVSDKCTSTGWIWASTLVPYRLVYASDCSMHFPINHQEYRDLD